MDRRSLSTADLEEHLRRQMRFLRNSSQLFDQGDEDEATRLAVTLRVLLYDAGTSHSLLGQLGHLNQFFVDTCVYRDDFDGPGIEETGDGHLTYRVDGQTHDIGFLLIAGEDIGAPRWEPVYGRRGLRLVSFESWWKRPAIETPGLRQFSRLELIKVAANQDGGAHVDPAIDRLYDEFAQRGHDVGIVLGLTSAPDVIRPEQILRPQGNTVAASIRQIAWEVDQTIKITLGI